MVSVPVRELIEFALRGGNLGSESDFVGRARALAGTRGHQQIQRSRPAGYQKEVPVAYEVDAGELILRIQGRIDGFLATPEEVLLEEIKTIQGSWGHVADPLHWAQAKLYGYIYAHDHVLEKITLQLTYLDLDTGELTEFRETLSAAELAVFFGETTAIYLEWVLERHRWCQQRDRSIRSLDFPFPEYRPGQRKLAVAAYRTLARGGRLFLEAPTGIGKTMSVLFPAIKALAEGKLERIFYLTARTVGRVVAEQALGELRQAGLRLRTLTLTAKEKLCVQEGQPCDPGNCPFAIGYYDRRKPAMRDALSHDGITRAVLEAVALKHQVCPFELSLDLSAWVDAIVCDYNYVFDPKVYLRRHFDKESADNGLLVDEAHNLVDRAREMFSAEIHSREIQEVRRAIKSAVPRCAKAFTRLISAMRKIGGASELITEPAEPADLARELNLFPSGQPTEELPARPAPRRGLPQNRNPGQEVRTIRELPAQVIPLIEDALNEAEAWLAKNQPAAFRQRLLELFFRLHSFLRVAGIYDEHFVTIVESGEAVRLRLFCLDPSHLLREALQRGKAAVFFSATLTPIDYYRTLLGGDESDPLLQLPSPFPPENLAVLVHSRIRTNLRARTETLTDVLQAIAALVECRHGNYLIYLPSYEYLGMVREPLAALLPAVRIMAQRPGMTEGEREAFLAAFAGENPETLVGFAVMGGIFGEGIDLVGDRLIGAVIVGVGLPQITVERDLIRDYFQEKTGAGFEYAYSFPGMNRVLQAAGRVIRSETDRGVVLFIDTRFAHERYRCLFPRWWQPVRVASVSDIREAVHRFWRPP